MRAIVFHGIGDIRLENVPDPIIEQPTDAIVRLTTSAICGTDLHMVRGTLSGMVPGTILGHEGVGIIEALGDDVRNLQVGDRVVIPSTIACGSCAYCRDGYFSQCDTANPNGPLAGTAFFGGPAQSGPFHGLQAEKARIPFANVGLVKLPAAIPDEQAILLSDILPTAYFGAKIAEIKPGNTVAIFGCGPVGLLAIQCALHFKAGMVIAIDCLPDRLDKARELGAATVNYEAEDPVETIRRLTGGIGVDRAIDAVGVDANRAHHGPAAAIGHVLDQEFRHELRQLGVTHAPAGTNWHPGDAPAQTLIWAAHALAKAGTLSIIGVYPEAAMAFPIGVAMNKNLTLQMGNCPHRRYIPELIELVGSGAIDPSRILTDRVSLTDDVMRAFAAFDRREPNVNKVTMAPASVP
ncbi:MAG: glutathione-dependent formaldehyde dehydrogenase [Candidatus Sericytochromatia bacterium]|nr:glutathione-dependent formaldehyde dehydrogenase [Candidatus Sericytochromatia bacterium]